MAANTFVRARIDRTVKERAATALNDMGLSISDVIRALLFRVAEESRLPFDPKAAVSSAVGRNMKSLNQSRSRSLEYYQLFHHRFKPLVTSSGFGRQLVEFREQIAGAAMGVSTSDAIRALLFRMADEGRLAVDAKVSVSSASARNGKSLSQPRQKPREHYQLLHERFKPFVPHSSFGRQLVQFREQIAGAAFEHHATNVRVFGRVARGEDNLGTLSLLVDLEDPADRENLSDLQHELEELLKVRVYIVTEMSLRPHIRSEVLAEACAL